MVIFYMAFLRILLAKMAHLLGLELNMVEVEQS